MLLPYQRNNDIPVRTPPTDFDTLRTVMSDVFHSIGCELKADAVSATMPGEITFCATLFVACTSKEEELAWN